MKLHANAALSLKGRRDLCRRVVEQERTLTEAAEAAGVSVRCARKWVARYRAEGELGLHDRSSAPHRVPHRTSEQRVQAIAALRRLRRAAVRRDGEVRLRLRLAELRSPGGRSGGGRAPRHELRDDSHGGDLREVRRAPRPRLPGRPAADRDALLHERRGAALRAGAGSAGGLTAHRGAWRGLSSASQPLAPRHPVLVSAHRPGGSADPSPAPAIPRGRTRSHALQEPGRRPDRACPAVRPAAAGGAGLLGKSDEPVAALYVGLGEQVQDLLADHAVADDDERFAGRCACAFGGADLEAHAPSGSPCSGLS